MTGSDPQQGAEALDQKVADLADRLCREFAPAGGDVADEVRRLVADARAAFGTPKVVTYLPVLIERAVRERLTAAAHEADGRPECGRTLTPGQAPRREPHLR